ncbi:hypothetical protein [Nocardioides sp. URHA0032]|uniref:hypothetical protein n=1 Tax=Nocardioides sp. URHA0032 TaxID=1380388 RepID=UPI00048E2C31|nr:hypothetical protein [Nocardioides sp. URHA0032]
MSQETFERELARRADDVHAAPLSFQDVRGRARSIQRRRRAAVAGTVAAAVALVVIVPSVLTGGHGKDSRAPEPAPPVPGHTAVLHDRKVEMPDGTTVDLPVDNAHVAQLGVLTDGRIVVAMQKPYVVRVYQPDGTLQQEFPVASNAITMSARDDAVAWVDPDHTVRVLSTGVADPAVLPGIPMPGEAYGTIDAVLDAEHLLVGDGTTTSGELTPAGATDLAGHDKFRVLDVSPVGTLWAVSFLPDAAHEDGGCAGLYDPETREITAQSCSAYTLAFAPDGQHLVSGYYENNMVGGVKVLDLDLRPVATVEPAGRTSAVSRVAWADADHVLASVTDWQSSTWTLERVGLDGADPDVLEGPATGSNPERVAEYILSE